MQYVGQRARCLPTARVAVFRRIVECLAHRCDQAFAHLAEAVDLLLRRRERKLAPVASVPLEIWNALGTIRFSSSPSARTYSRGFGAGSSGGSGGGGLTIRSSRSTSARSRLFSASS
jgi:hypothetical protein